MHLLPLLLCEVCNVLKKVAGCTRLNPVPTERHSRPGAIPADTSLLKDTPHRPDRRLQQRRPADTHQEADRGSRWVAVIQAE